MFTSLTTIVWRSVPKLLTHVHKLCPCDWFGMRPRVRFLDFLSSSCQNIQNSLNTMNTIVLNQLPSRKEVLSVASEDHHDFDFNKTQSNRRIFAYSTTQLITTSSDRSYTHSVKVNVQEQCSRFWNLYYMKSLLYKSCNLSKNHKYEA